MSFKGKTQNIDTAVKWNFKSHYKGKNISISLIDKKDVVYVIWDIHEKLLERKNLEVIDELKFEISVTPKKKSKHLVQF